MRIKSFIFIIFIGLCVACGDSSSTTSNSQNEEAVTKQLETSSKKLEETKKDLDKKTQEAANAVDDLMKEFE